MTLRSILTARRSVPSGRRAGFRPRLESLEDREVPATFTVSNLADAGNGSLRQAVLHANALLGADTIHFADGLQGTIALTGGQLSITDHLTIDGPGAGLLAVSGNHQSRVFNISGGLTVAIDDLTITDGRAVGTGGGILNTGSTLTLDRVVLSNNQAVGAPGGVVSGGAVANRAGATLIVSDSLLAQNRALGGTGPRGVGGAIANQGSRLTVNRSSFLGNQAAGGSNGATGMGGGIEGGHAGEPVQDRAREGEADVDRADGPGDLVREVPPEANTLDTDRRDGMVDMGQKRLEGSIAAEDGRRARAWGGAHGTVTLLPKGDRRRRATTSQMPPS